MNATDVQAELLDLIDLNDSFEGSDVRMNTFEDAGLLTNDSGLVLIIDGKKFLCTITES